MGTIHIVSNACNNKNCTWVNTYGRFINYRIAHDDDFSSYGPGKIIDDELIKRCFDNHLEIFDMGGGDVKYKLEWTDDIETVKTFVFSFNHFVPKLITIKFLLSKELIAYLKKLKWYDSFKIYTLGKAKHLLTGGYFRDFKETIKRLKDKKKRIWIKDNITSFLSNIYSTGEYNIYKKCLSNKKQRNNYQDNSQNKSNHNKDINSIHEVNHDQIDFISEVMNKPIEKIVKRFYNTQRYYWSCYMKLTLSITIQ